MENRSKVNVPNEKLIDFCKKNHIRKLSFFGSVLTNRFRPDSDVDILVEFESGKGPGFFELSGMELELSQLVGRRVDLRTPKELSCYFRDQVMASARRDACRSFSNRRHPPSATNLADPSSGGKSFIGDQPCWLVPD